MVPNNILLFLRISHKKTTLQVARAIGMMEFEYERVEKDHLRHITDKQLCALAEFYHLDRYQLSLAISTAAIYEVKASLYESFKRRFIHSEREVHRLTKKLAAYARVADKKIKKVETESARENGNALCKSREGKKANQ